MSSENISNNQLGFWVAAPSSTEVPVLKQMVQFSELVFSNQMARECGNGIEVINQKFNGPTFVRVLTNTKSNVLLAIKMIAAIILLPLGAILLITKGLHRLCNNFQVRQQQEALNPIEEKAYQDEAVVDQPECVARNIDDEKREAQLREQTRIRSQIQTLEGEIRKVEEALKALPELDIVQMSEDEIRNWSQKKGELEKERSRMMFHLSLIRPKSPEIFPVGKASDTPDQDLALSDGDSGQEDPFATVPEESDDFVHENSDQSPELVLTQGSPQHSMESELDTAEDEFEVVQEGSSCAAASSSTSSSQPVTVDDLSKVGKTGTSEFAKELWESMFTQLGINPENISWSPNQDQFIVKIPETISGGKPIKVWYTKKVLFFSISAVVSIKDNEFIGTIEKTDKKTTITLRNIFYYHKLTAGELPVTISFDNKTLEWKHEFETTVVKNKKGLEDLISENQKIFSFFKPENIKEGEPKEIYERG